MHCGGGAAVVVAAAENGRSAPHRAVALLGAGERITDRALSQAPGLTTSPLAAAISDAYAMAASNRDPWTCSRCTTATPSSSPSPWKMPVYAPKVR